MSAQQFMTPKGIAVYPWLNKPDTKFNPEGKYKTGLRVKPDEVKDLIATIKKANQEAHGPKADKARVPYTLDEETGDIILRLQTNYQPKLVDSSGQVIPPSDAPMIWGGSTLKIKGVVKTYNAGGNLGASLQIRAVQVIDLSDTSTDEFDAVEGGFVAEISNGYQEEQAAAQHGAQDFNF